MKGGGVGGGGLGRSIYADWSSSFFSPQVILLVYRSYLICEHPNPTLYIRITFSTLFSSSTIQIFNYLFKKLLTIFQWAMRFSLTFFFFSFSPIETIFSWVRQMFGVIKQKLNEQTIQMAEFKKEQITDKTELKNKNMQPRWLIFELYY